MIKVIVGNQTVRKPEFVTPDTTIYALLEKVGIEHTAQKTYLIGRQEFSLVEADFNKSFADFGVVDGECYLFI